MVAHFVCVLYTGFIAYVAKPGTSLFSWHPFLMTLAFTLLMTEGILVFSRESSLMTKLSHKTKVQIHWVLQGVAVTAAFLGFAAIYYNKVLNDKPHFTTWHGLVGVCTLCYIALQSVGGACVKYYKYMKGFKLAQLKLYHATSALVAFTFVAISLWLGMSSNWFVTNVTGTSWYACMACPSILALVVMQQITSAYSPVQQHTH